MEKSEHTFEAELEFNSGVEFHSRSWNPSEMIGAVDSGGYEFAEGLLISADATSLRRIWRTSEGGWNIMEVKSSGGTWIISEGTGLLWMRVGVFCRVRMVLGWCVAVEVALRVPLNPESSVQGFWDAGGGLWEPSLMLSPAPRAGHHPPGKP